MSTAPASEIPSRVPRARRRKGKRVLVVEDDALLALDLQQALVRAGSGEVVLCASMAQATAALEDWVPHAVVLDVHLADRDDGWALAEMISLLGARPPRIVFSTGTPEAIPEEVRRMGPVYTKPYDTDGLARELLGSDRSALIGRLRDALR